MFEINLLFNNIFAMYLYYTIQCKTFLNVLDEREIFTKEREREFISRNYALHKKELFSLS